MADITALIERTEEMNNSGDAEGWADLFAEGAIYTAGGRHTSGAG